MAKTDIISGFLGAGKTTLIKKLIGEAFQGEKVVLIENEFGESVQVNELNSGCICCSLVGDFGEALKQVVTDYTPDRIIIEPSGVGKLSDVIKAIQKAAETVEIHLNSATTVVDVTKAKVYMKNFGEFFLNQVEACGTVVLSRTQSVSEEKLLQAVALVKEHNAEARIITTPWDDISGTVILDAMEHSSSIEDIMKNFKYDAEEEEEHEHHHHHHDDDDDDEHEHHHHHHDDDEEEHEHHHHHHDDDDDDEHEHHHEHHHHYDENGVCSCGHHHHHHHGHDADEIFISWGRETAKKFDRTVLDGILQKLSAEEGEYGMILRAKGIIPDTDGVWMEFDLVPGEYEIRNGNADYTGKLCVIGSELKEDKLAELFGL